MILFLLFQIVQQAVMITMKNLRLELVLPSSIMSWWMERLMIQWMLRSLHRGVFYAWVLHVAFLWEWIYMEPQNWMVTLVRSCCFKKHVYQQHTQWNKSLSEKERKRSFCFLIIYTVTSRSIHSSVITKYVIFSTRYVFRGSSRVDNMELMPSTFHLYVCVYIACWVPNFISSSALRYHSNFSIVHISSR